MNTGKNLVVIGSEESLQTELTCNIKDANDDSKRKEWEGEAVPLQDSLNVLLETAADVDEPDIHITLGFIKNETLVCINFSAQDASILKISVPIMKRRSWGFQNTPNLQSLHDFKPSYGTSKKAMFWLPFSNLQSKLFRETYIFFKLP